MSARVGSRPCATRHGDLGRRQETDKTEHLHLIHVESSVACLRFHADHCNSKVAASQNVMWGKQETLVKLCFEKKADSRHTRRNCSNKFRTPLTHYNCLN
jgi:hypothetical protein